MKKRPEFQVSKVISIKSGAIKDGAGAGSRPAERPAQSALVSYPVFTKVDNVIYPQEFLPRGDELAVRWARQIGAAMTAWGKLGKAELVETGGREHNLARLVEERYDITRDEAEALVRMFFEKQSFQLDEGH